MEDKFEKVEYKTLDEINFLIPTKSKYYDGLFKLFNEHETIPYNYEDLSYIFNRIEIPKHKIIKLLKILLKNLDFTFDFKNYKPNILEWITTLDENITFEEVSNLLNCKFKKDFSLNYDKIKSNIYNSEDFNSIYDYENFDSRIFFIEKLNFKDDKLIKHILDNFYDLESEYEYGMRPIHFICSNSTPEMIKYIIDKGVDLECEDNQKWRPIHFICSHSTPEMIKYIIDKGVNLECENYEKWRPIHFICRYSTPEMIKYIIDKNVDLECECECGWRPIHIICRHSTPEMIKYIIDKNVDLECKNENKLKPIDFICAYSTPEMEEYITEKMQKK